MSSSCGCSKAVGQVLGRGSNSSAANKGGTGEQLAAGERGGAGAYRGANKMEKWEMGGLAGNPESMRWVLWLCHPPIHGMDVLKLSQRFHGLSWLAGWLAGPLSCNFLNSSSHVIGT